MILYDNFLRNDNDSKMNFHGKCVAEHIIDMPTGALTLCILETLKLVLWQTVKTQVKCRRRVFTFC